MEMMVRTWISSTMRLYQLKKSGAAVANSQSVPLDQAPEVHTLTNTADLSLLIRFFLLRDSSMKQMQQAVCPRTEIPDCRIGNSALLLNKCQNGHILMHQNLQGYAAEAFSH